MYIGLIDLDIFSYHSFIPNLAIMKYSSYYKQQNHFVELVLDLNDLEKYDAVVIQKRYVDSPYPSQIWSKKILAMGGEAFSPNYQYKIPLPVANYSVDTSIYRRYLINFPHKKEVNRKRQQKLLDETAFIEVIGRRYEDIKEDILKQVGEKKRIILMLTEFNVVNRIKDFNILVRLRKEFGVRLTVMEDQIWINDVSRAAIAKELSMFRPFYTGYVNTIEEYLYVRFDYSPEDALKLLEIKNTPHSPIINLFIENHYDFTYNLANLLNLYGFLITNGKNFRCFDVILKIYQEDSYIKDFLKLLDRWQTENQGKTSFSTFYYMETKDLSYDAFLKKIIKERPEALISCQACPQELQRKGGLWNYDKLRNQRKN